MSLPSKEEARISYLPYETRHGGADANRKPNFTWETKYVEIMTAPPCHFSSVNLCI